MTFRWRADDSPTFLLCGFQGIWTIIANLRNPIFLWFSEWGRDPLQSDLDLEKENMIIVFIYFNIGQKLIMSNKFFKAIKTIHVGLFYHQVLGSEKQTMLNNALMILK